MTRALALLLFGFSIAACTTAPLQPLNSIEGMQRWQQREHALARVTTWRSEGRIALNSGDDGVNASYTWSQYDTVYDIALRGPFGAGAVTILGSPEGVAVRRDDELLLGFNAQQLLLEKFGWMLPVDAVEHWVIGRPDPKAEHRIEVDNLGRIVKLHQADWVVEYKSYVPVGDLELPGKMFAHSHRVGLRMVVDQWTLN